MKKAGTHKKSRSVQFHSDSDKPDKVSPTEKKNQVDVPIPVNFGFLRAGNTYATRIIVDVPVKALTLQQSHEEKDPELSITFKDLVGGVAEESDAAGKEDQSDGRPHTEVEITLKAVKEGPYHNSFTLLVHGDKDIMVEISGTVMGKMKGTPQLRANVFCVAKDNSTDDDSDWPGFERARNLVAEANKEAEQEKGGEASLKSASFIGSASLSDH